jgi:hypothetical protein
VDEIERQTMSQPPSERSYSTAGVAALIVIGLLLLIPSGLCTAVLGGGAIWETLSDPSNASDLLNTLPMVVIVAGPFLLGGGAMLIVGIRRARANARNRRTPP